MFIEDIDTNNELAEAFANDLIEEMITLLCFENEQLCGTVSWEIRGGIDDGVVEIIGLGVREPYKRRGVATRLVESAVKDASEAFMERGYELRRAFLFMESNNEIARKFYTKIGFEEVASIPDFYPSHGASIFLKKL